MAALPVLAARRDVRLKALVRGISCVFLLCLALPACKRTSAEPASTGGEAPEATGVEPVYRDPKAADPLVERLCAALHTRPRIRWADCCADKPGVIVTPECVRVLSSAVESGTIRLEASAVDRCVAAVDRATEGCGWVGVWPLGPPPECSGLLAGGVEKGQLCRSSLECAGNMRCFGLTPTQAGRCVPTPGEGSFCAASADPLAVYARQDDVDEQHPACQGTCDRGRCVASLRAGDACTSNAQCGAGHRCAAGVCQAGARAARGEPCLQSGCAAGLRCVASRCEAPRAEGERCTKDDECLGGCVVEPGAAAGTCQPICQKMVNLKVVRERPAGAATSSAAR